MYRLNTVAPTIVSLLAGTTDAQRVIISAAIVDWILERAAVEDATVVSGRRVLHAKDFGDSSVRSQIWELVERLDNVAWDLQDEKNESGNAASATAFARARAVNSLWYALAGVDVDSLMDCAYEAQAAFGDIAGLESVVTTAIASGD